MSVNIGNIAGIIVRIILIIVGVDGVFDLPENKEALIRAKFGQHEINETDYNSLFEEENAQIGSGKKKLKKMKKKLKL